MRHVACVTLACCGLAALVSCEQPVQEGDDGASKADAPVRPDRSSDGEDSTGPAGGAEDQEICGKEAADGFWAAVAYQGEGGAVREATGDGVYLAFNDLALSFQWDDGVVQNGIPEWVDYDPASTTHALAIDFFEATSEDGKTVYEGGVTKYVVSFADGCQTLRLRVQDSKETLVLKRLERSWK